MKTKREVPAQQLHSFLDQVAPEGGLERLAEDNEQLEIFKPVISQLAQTDSEISRAIEVIPQLGRTRGEELSLEELSHEDRIVHEAIIMPLFRPVIDIINDSFETPEGMWNHLGKKKIKEKIEAAIPSVGRLELPDDPLYTFVGTGFVVGADLVMTNRHVADIFCSGLGVRGLKFRPGRSAGIDFREENSEAESIYIDIREIVMVHPYWDMALLRVNGLPDDQKSLGLSLEHPEALTSREVVVIGYPAFDERNDVDLQNRIFRGVFNVKRLQPGVLTGQKTVRSFENLVEALKHNASTLGGNSGSAVLDITSGEVVGLHFGGVYLDSNYAVPVYELSQDQRVVDAGVKFVGNPSPLSILPWEPRWRAADPQEVIVDGSGDSLNQSDLIAPVVSVSDSVVTPESVTWNIPLQITVSVGKATLAQLTGSAPLGTLEVEAPPTEPDDDYSNREGYDANFLPGYEVRIPWLTDEQYENTIRPSIPGFPSHVLPYHHFSLVMNRERKMAYFTMVNIDGAREVEIKRKEFRDKWSVDPRIDSLVQMDNDYYRGIAEHKNPLDRGHLVRRIDPCWGNTREDAEKAHHDTFHYTNCAPQHEDFNRFKTYWAGVENYILDKANVQDARVSLFTGPVFREDDPVFMAPAGVQVQIPLEYWKVVVWVRDDGSLAASGYLLSQSGKIDQMIEVQFGAYRNYQVAISEIESLTELSFRDLSEHDVFADGTEAIPGRRRVLLSLADVTF
jgi:endonuclease G